MGYIGFGPSVFPPGGLVCPPFVVRFVLAPVAFLCRVALTAKESRRGSVFRVSTPAEQKNKAQRKRKMSSPGCRRRRRHSCVSKIAAHRSGFSIVSRSLKKYRIHR